MRWGAVVGMKKKARPTAKLINTDDQENRRQFDAFAALVQKQRLGKIEKALEIPSPSKGFRDWLIKVLWRLDRSSQSDARVRSSRAALKRELRKSANLAAKLKASAWLLWKSGEPTIDQVLQDFQDFTLWQSWQSMHSSGIAWVAALDEFANRTLLLADALPDDAGGPRRAVAFDELLLVLAHYYRTLARERGQSLSEKQFFDFAAEVTDLVRSVAERRPAASIMAPPNDRALRERLRRVTLKTSTRSST
jgi:hypothetical protein